MKVDASHQRLGPGHKPESHSRAQHLRERVEPQNATFRVQGQKTGGSFFSKLENKDKIFEGNDLKGWDSVIKAAFFNVFYRSSIACVVSSFIHFLSRCLFGPLQV